MWLHRLTGYLLKNRWQALAMTFIAAFFPIIGIVSILIAALVTLTKGLVEGAVFMLAATVPYLLAFYFAGSHEAALPVVAWAAVGVAVLSNVLTWLFAVMLQQRHTWSDILQTAALLGVLAISLAHFAFPEIASWWGEALKHYSAHAQTVAAGANGSAVELTPAQIQNINESKWMATGIMVSAILFNAILQLIVARWWQATVFKPGTLQRELRNIRLSQLAGGLFILSIVVWYIGNTVIQDILPVLFLLFSAAGLSLVHYLFGLMQPTPMIWFWLFLFYMALVFLMPASVMVVAGLGLLDIWMDFRKRIVKL